MCFLSRPHPKLIHFLPGCLGPAILWAKRWEFSVSRTSAATLPQPLVLRPLIITRPRRREFHREFRHSSPRVLRDSGGAISSSPVLLRRNHEMTRARGGLVLGWKTSFIVSINSDGANGAGCVATGKGFAAWVQAGGREAGGSRG